MTAFGLSAFDLQGPLPLGCHGEALGWRLVLGAVKPPGPEFLVHNL